MRHENDYSQYSKDKLIEYIHILEREKTKRIKSNLEKSRINQLLEYENIRMSNITNLITKAYELENLNDIFELIAESVLLSFECENVLIFKNIVHSNAEIIYDYSENYKHTVESFIDNPLFNKAILIEDLKVFKNNPTLKNSNGMTSQFFFKNECYVIVAYTSDSMKQRYLQITAEHLPMLYAMTRQINTVLNNLSLTQEIKETQTELIYTMGSIAELRSQETGNHVKRVAKYSKLLALHYGMSEEDASMLEEASPMHDLGKIAIPDDILNKPGRHTTVEFETMKKHAFLGYEMIKKSKHVLLETAAIVAHEHHEKWDGSGYPRGLQGKDIHIYGRITAIADVFDALGSDRIYKKAWSDKEIFTLLKEQRGKHFDPTLIDIFFDNIDDIFLIRNNFADQN